KRPNVGRDEAGNVEGTFDAGFFGAGSDVVTVVEHFGAASLQGEHRVDFDGQRAFRAIDVTLGIARSELDCLLEREAYRDVTAERIVGGGLLGHEVRRDAALDESRVDLGRVRADRDGPRFASSTGGVDGGERGVEIVDALIEVTGGETLGDTVGIDLDREA